MYSNTFYLKAYKLKYYLNTHKFRAAQTLQNCILKSDVKYKYEKYIKIKL